MSFEGCPHVDSLKDRLFSGGCLFSSSDVTVAGLVVATGFPRRDKQG
jgi:hypothetical protein